MSRQTPPPDQDQKLKSNVYKCKTCSKIFRAPITKIFCKSCKSGENIILATREEKREYNNSMKVKKTDRKNKSTSRQAPGMDPGEDPANKTEAEIHEEDLNEFKTKKKPGLKEIDVNNILNSPEDPGKTPGLQDPGQDPGTTPQAPEPGSQEVKPQDPAGPILQDPGQPPGPQEKKPGFKIPLIPVLIVICCLTVFIYLKKKKKSPEKEEDREENKILENREDFFNPPGF